MLVGTLSSIFYRPTRRTGPRLVTDRDSQRSDADNRRGFYRISFPEAVRPRLLLDSPGTVHPVCEVTECSERGVRFRVPARWLLPVGSNVSGTIRFGRGTDVHVSGTVTRMQRDEVALHLGREGIPLAAILDEQRYLRTRFAGED